MALPVPHDIFISQPIEFAAGQPPVMPPISAPPDLVSWLPYIVSRVANEVTSKAGANPSRVFTYNLLSLNGWNNQYFTEAVELAVWLIKIELNRRTHTNVEAAIPDSAEKAVTLMTSKYVFEFPELKAYSQPQLIDIAMTNYGVLNSLKQEIANMQRFAGQAPMAAQQPMYLQQQQPMYPQQQPMYPQQQMYPQQMPSPMMQQQPMYPQQMYPQQLQQPMMPAGLGVAQTGQISSSGGAPLQQQMAQSNRYSTAATKTTPVIIVEKEKENRSMTTITNVVVKPLQEAETMDRQQHTLYFAGNSYPLDRFARTADMERQVRDMAEVDDGETTSVYLNPTAIMTTTLENVVFESRFIQRQRQHAGEEVDVFRCLAINVIPFICHESYRDIIETIVNKTSLAEMATEFKTISTSLANTQEANYRLEMVDILEYLDREMTKLILRFLRTEMAADINIDSMSADGKDLGAYIAGNFSEHHIAAFNRFEKELSKSLNFMSREDEQSLRETIVDDSGLEVTLVASSVSVTVIDMYNRELGINLKDGAYIIDANRHRLLYELASSLDSNKGAKNWVSNTDYLVTRDDVRYTLHKSYVTDNQYLIRKA